MRCFAIFDVDHTLLNGSTGKELAVSCVRRGIVSASILIASLLVYLRYRIGHLDPSILEKGIHRLAGIPIQKLSELAEEIFHSKVRPKLYSRALEFIRRERAEGKAIVLATSAPECVVRPLADCLNVEYLLATKFEAEDGLLTGRFQGEPVFGDGKERKVLEFIRQQGSDLGCCSFYSDSWFDHPLLERVKSPYVVNPDVKLRRLAQIRGWPIYHLRDTAGNRDIQHMLTTGKLQNEC
ncbi:MAG: HAD family hydrolase [Spirochaetia bacterium]